MLLRLSITCYIIGLLVFYTAATFDTRVWDIAYFGWAKLFDAGVLVWAVLYYNLKKPDRELVKWVYVFSFARFGLDIQSFFTGVGINNEWIIAASFLILLIVISILTIKEYQNVSNKK